MKTMGVNITTIAYLGVLIIEIGSTIILMVVEAQGIVYQVFLHPRWLPLGFLKHHQYKIDFG